MRIGKHRKTQSRFHVAGKKDPIQGAISIILGVAALIVMLTACVMSGNAKGAGGIELGLMGFVSWIFAIAGLVVAIIGLRKRDVRYRYSITGLVWNGILFLVYTIIYVMGLVI